MTDAELKLWKEIRAHRLMGLGFGRQVPTGPCIADFVCPAHLLIVEIDGSQHAAPEQVAHDEARAAYLNGRRWTLLRFWNDDILRDIHGVCQHIIVSAGLTHAATKEAVA